MLKAKSKPVPQARQRKQVPLFSTFQEFRMGEHASKKEPQDAFFDKEEFKDVTSKVNTNKRNKSKPTEF